MRESYKLIRKYADKQWFTRLLSQICGAWYELHALASTKTVSLVANPQDCPISTLMPGRVNLQSGYFWLQWKSLVRNTDEQHTRIQQAQFPSSKPEVPGACRLPGDPAGVWPDSGYIAGRHSHALHRTGQARWDLWTLIPDAKGCLRWRTGSVRGKVYLDVPVNTPGRLSFGF